MKFIGFCGGVKILIRFVDIKKEDRTDGVDLTSLKLFKKMGGGLAGAIFDVSMG